VSRFFALAVTILLPAAALAAEPFKLNDGDRVVWIGNTLIEREQRYGYWETALTERFPGVTFRNLGWSGDSVFGEARASFDPPAVGYKRLIDHTLALKPTVLFVGYGTNESFAGTAGLEKFTKQLDKLLDDLAPAKARLVLLAPLKQEDLGRPLPDPTQQNKNLRLYADALKQTAEKRKAEFVDLYDLVPDGTKTTPPAPLTDNGMHLTAQGYRRAALALEEGLGLKPLPWEVVRPAKKGADWFAQGTKLSLLEYKPLRFDVTDTVVPLPSLPKDSSAVVMPDNKRVLRISDLPDGSHTLKIDGKEILTATAKEWAEGVTLDRGPEFEQAEQLRQAIVDKNRQYFHRWRPENETYLFGFRKQEQGQNAKEIPQFDPFIEKMEKDIAKLREPVIHHYELVPKR
jgi:lysophospholipase L1-like esterase